MIVTHSWWIDSTPIAKAQQDALDRNLAGNPIFGPTRERVVVEEKDEEELLALCLFASSHPTHTSPALRYLACDAATLPLPPKPDQIRLEVAVSVDPTIWSKPGHRDPGGPTNIS
jgi:hypothetical protein